MLIRQIASEPFKTALTKLLSQDMPIKTTIAIKNIVNIVNNQINEYDKVRHELLSKHAVHIDGVMQIKEDRTAVFDDNGYKNYVEEYNKLINVDVQVPTITLQELGDKVNISYEDLITLDGLILY